MHCEPEQSYNHNLALEMIMKMHALVSKMKQFDKCASFVCRNNWNGCQIVISLINNFKILGQQKLELHTMWSLHYSTLNQDCVSFEYLLTYRNYSDMNFYIFQKVCSAIESQSDPLLRLWSLTYRVRLVCQYNLIFTFTLIFICLFGRTINPFTRLSINQTRVIILWQTE